MTVEKRVAQLPAGPLFVRLESFPDLEDAEAATGSYALSGQTADGRAWLFTLGPSGGSTPGGTLVAEVGPLTAPRATEYLFRVQESNTPPGREGDIHTHPGAEGWYVLEDGEQTVRTPAGDVYVGPGQTAVGPPVGTPMQILANATRPRRAITVLLLDAAQPVSSPAQFAAPVPAAQPPAPAPARPAAPPAQMPGQLPRTGGGAAPLEAAMLLGFGLFASGSLLRRVRR